VNYSELTVSPAWSFQTLDDAPIGTWAAAIKLTENAKTGKVPLRRLGAGINAG
jgi:hypothetical protein